MERVREMKEKKERKGLYPNWRGSWPITPYEREREGEREIQGVGSP